MSEQQLYKVGDFVLPIDKKKGTGAEFYFRVTYTAEFEKDGQKKFRYWVTPTFIPGTGYSWEQDEILKKHPVNFTEYFKGGKRRKTRRRR